MLEPKLSNNELWDLGSILTQQCLPIAREKSGLKTLDPLSVSGFFLAPPLSPTISTLSNILGSHLRFETTNFPISFQRQHHLLNYQESIFKGTLINNESHTTIHKTEKQNKSVNPNVPLNATLQANTRSTLRIDDDEASTVMDATLMQYRNAIGHIVVRQPYVETMFSEFYGSVADHERARAIDSTVLVLHVYSENAADCILGRANDFAPLCNILARLCPRLADSLCAVRVLSLRAIWLAFKLSLLRRGHSPQDTDLVDAALFDVAKFTDEYLGNEGKLDPLQCRSAINAIAKEVEKRLPQSQVQIYISVLLKMLSDRQSSVGSSSAQLLSTIMSDRGHMLHAEVIFLLLLNLFVRPKN